jgi:NAD(P)H-hydrate repair Nnr-like enzyme with NAD(P)H-hydrate dehydratase domain
VVARRSTPRWPPRSAPGGPARRCRSCSTPTRCPPRLPRAAPTARSRPHPGEAARLLGCAVSEVEADRLGAAARLAERGAVVLKGPHSVVRAQGEPPWLNPTGNPILATGGTGDVLAGVIGALLARGVPAFAAVRMGTFVHGRAADLLRARRSQGFVASDVVRALPLAIEELA